MAEMRLVICLLMPFTEGSEDPAFVDKNKEY
jgi:hypothetical protein